MTEKLIRTENEAIECLKNNKPRSGYYMLQESVDMAIQTLEKQIPHKARDISGDGIERYVCECGNLMHRKQAYCDKCGQRLEV